MSLNSVNTNMGAMVALSSLQKTQEELSVTQKQISTGYRVADSTDDGAAYAVAQSVRSQVGALGAANQSLGGVQGLLSTTQHALNDVSNTMMSMHNVLVNLSSSNTSASQKSDYQTQYKTLLTQVQGYIQDAAYNGKTLIGDISNSNGTFTRVSVARNEVGSTYGIATMSGSAFYTSIAFNSTALGVAATSIAAMITATGVFTKMSDKVNTNLQSVGSSINYVTNQVSYNNDKIDALNSGLGALVDADLAKESAQLTALQIRQQLGTQALSLSNQAPQTLLSLFK